VKSEQKTVVMPKLGLTMTEATITDWQKQSGEAVERGEILFSFESDKATLEFESPAGGYLHILVESGETVPVYTPVAVLTPQDAATFDMDEVSSAAQAAEAEIVEETLGTNSVNREIGRRSLATPRARALAKRKGISLAGIVGSGMRGMVVVGDLDGAKAPREIAASPVARKLAAETGVDLGKLQGTGRRGMITRNDVMGALIPRASSALPAPVSQEIGGLEGLSGLRGVIANRLSQGWRERPQVTLTRDLDAGNLVTARARLGELMGEKISFDALLANLIAKAMVEFPYINVQLSAQGIMQNSGVHIGVAVDTTRGLLVPVVKDVDTKDLETLNQELAELVSRANDGKSLPEDLEGGSFTITNLGMYGIDAFTPIINPPECAILGVGRIVERVVVYQGEITLRPMMVLSLAFDHRLVDGAPAARFLEKVSSLIEAAVFE
jgi:pyruvate dehydrogenase E2 component (dihydrolipoamide acetyltransferase)